MQPRHASQVHPNTAIRQGTGRPRMLYCGDLTPGSTAEMRMRALRELGFDVTCAPLWPTAPTRVVRFLMAASFKLRHPIDFVGANAAIIELGMNHDIVWIDKGITVRRGTLRELRRRNPAVRIIGYSPDNMAERPSNSRHFLRSLPEYDAFITTKSFGNGWSALRPPLPGTLRLHPSVDGPDYAATLARCRIALCFLRRLSKDLQTTRSVEIPACGTFMLAERTKEHQALFAEGEEAEYFSGAQEMIEKIRRYLHEPQARARIALAGFRRTRAGRYSYAWRLHAALAQAGVHPPHEPTKDDAGSAKPTPDLPCAAR